MIKIFLQMAALIDDKRLLELDIPINAFLMPEGEKLCRI